MIEFIKKWSEIKCRKKPIVSKRHYLHAAALRGKVLEAVAPYKYGFALTAPEEAGSDELGPVGAYVTFPFI